MRVPYDPKLVELFKDLNVRHFEALLPVVPVCQGIPDDAGELEDLNGLCKLEIFPTPGGPERATVKIYLAETLFETPWGSEEDRWQKISDTLLHEMVHLAVHVDALGDSHPFEDHHGEHFTLECNRIGKHAGWAEVLASAPGVDTDEDAVGWPDNAIERASHPPRIQDS